MPIPMLFNGFPSRWALTKRYKVIVIGRAGSISHWALNGFRAPPNRAPNSSSPPDPCPILTHADHIAIGINTLLAKGDWSQLREPPTVFAMRFVHNDETMYKLISWFYFECDKLSMTILAKHLRQYAKLLAGTEQAEAFEDIQIGVNRVKLERCQRANPNIRKPLFTWAYTIKEYEKQLVETEDYTTTRIVRFFTNPHRLEKLSQTTTAEMMSCARDEHHTHDSRWDPHQELIDLDY